MGHYCRVCGRVRANERFSGKGHRSHVCKDCARLPKGERQVVFDAEEIAGFLGQSNISQKNIQRLGELAESPDPETAARAELVLDVALVAPRRRRRLQILKRECPDLLERLEETGLIHDALPW